jgi:hypothetical protein
MRGLGWSLGMALAVGWTVDGAWAQTKRVPPPAPTPPGPTTGIPPGAGIEPVQSVPREWPASSGTGQRRDVGRMTMGIPPGAATYPEQIPPDEIHRYRSGFISTYTATSQLAEAAMSFDRRMQSKVFQTLPLDVARLTEIARGSFDGRVDTVYPTTWVGHLAPAGYDLLTARGVAVNWLNPTARVKTAIFERRPTDVTIFVVPAFTRASATALLRESFDVTFTRLTPFGSAEGVGPAAEVAKLQAAGVLGGRAVPTAPSIRPGDSAAPPWSNVGPPTDRPSTSQPPPGDAPKTVSPPPTPEPPMLRAPDVVIPRQPDPIDPVDIRKYHHKEKK